MLSCALLPQRPAEHALGATRSPARSVSGRALLADASGISPTALLAALYFASRHLSGINECLDAVMWQYSTVAVHTIPQGRAV
jgi:hypothetical protein